MTSYRSNEELFADVRELIASLDQSGRAKAAAELRSGFLALNGLTDGWAIFLDSIDAVRANRQDLSDSEHGVLTAIGDAVRALVFRR